MSAAGCTDEGPCTLATFRARMARRRRNLRDPNYAHSRDYPKWKPGVTTAAYIKLYEAMNRERIRCGPGFTFADRVAPYEQEEQS